MSISRDMFKPEKGSLHPPGLDAGGNGEGERIPWGLLEYKAYVADCRNDTTAVAYSRCGREIQVTFFPTRPPRVSYLCVFCRPATADGEAETNRTFNDKSYHPSWLNSCSDSYPANSQTVPKEWNRFTSRHNTTPPSLGRCAGSHPRHLKRYGRITREAELNLPLPARTNDLTHSPIGEEKAYPKTMDDRDIYTALSETEVTAIRIDHKTLQSLYACTQLGLQTGVNRLRHNPQLVTPNRKRHPPASLGSEHLSTLTLAPRAVKTFPVGQTGNSSPIGGVRTHPVPLTQIPHCGRQQLAGTPPTKASWCVRYSDNEVGQQGLSVSTAVVRNRYHLRHNTGLTQKLAPGSPKA
ncbi:hypothetical protein HU200_015262 [Digitaria exilis]|uniref:Uncharacterized protein n=1 Tax=Digitaria exilis TaxID=1010633 RepID=A0A835KIA0_9POAL|nr:hypothetical protein HU200_015262 [Digitaria exilis]